MKKTKQYFISGKMVHDLCSKSPRERLLHRLHSVALVLHGISASEVGRIYGDSPRAVSYWVKRFKKNGIEGLHEEARPGRPSKLNPVQLTRVQSFLERSRMKSKPANAEALSKYIAKEFRINLTVRQCWRIMKQLSD